MICWSCRAQLPGTARFCPNCEAEVVEELTNDGKAAVQDVFESMSPDLVGELREAFAKSTIGEEFVNRIMIGDCPACSSLETGDCENDPEIKDLCVARCFDCGQLWCLDCGELLKVHQTADHDCPTWEDDLELPCSKD